MLSGSQNWKPFWKLSCLACATAVTFTQGMYVYLGTVASACVLVSGNLLLSKDTLRVLNPRNE